MSWSGLFISVRNFLDAANLPITGRIIRDAVIPIRLFGWGRTQFECLWDFNSPLATRDPSEPFNGVRRFLIFPFGNQLSDYFVGMIEP